MEWPALIVSSTSLIRSEARWNGMPFCDLTAPTPWPSEILLSESVNSTPRIV